MMLAGHLSDRFSGWVLFGSLSVALGLALLATAIVMNFLIYKSSESRERFIKSPIDTLTMSLFALLLYGLIIFRIGRFHLPSPVAEDTCAALGGVLFLLGVAINLWGRKVLGDNWSNQIRIRSAHTLITKGPFRYVRHPLYASIMLMQFAVALVYVNAAVFVLNCFVYIPMMHYRAAQEEEALKNTFPEYPAYMAYTGRFFPKFGGSHESY